jgi:hypothetical protein
VPRLNAVQSRAAPAGRADSTARSLVQQALIRSRLVRSVLLAAVATGPTGLRAGTRPVAVGSDPRRDRHNRLVAANRADRSGTRHAAGGITSQTLTTTTTAIIAAESDPRTGTLGQVSVWHAKQAGPPRVDGGSGVPEGITRGQGSASGLGVASSGRWRVRGRARTSARSWTQIR